MHHSPLHRTWVEIDLSALVFNLRRIRSLFDKEISVIGVIKADAYGHGLHAVAQTLAAHGVKTLGVTNILEAQTASSAVPKADVLIFSPLLQEEISETIRHPRWIPTLSNNEELHTFEREAMRRKRRVRVHLKLDTGMGRVGGLQQEILSILQHIHGSKWLIATGLYSQLASADMDREESMRQMKKLHDFCQSARRLGVALPPVHFQNSAGIVRLNPHGLIKSVRPGLSLYGVPVPLSAWQRHFGPSPLRPVLAWKTRVALIRDMPRGTAISYGNTFRTRQPTRIAILAAGYADGIYRKLSNRGEVLIHGKRCRILGRVTMDMIIVDVTHLSHIQWGDTAVLIGKSGQEEITAADFANWAETNANEVLCNIGKRVPRIVVNG